jgi:hypothetical protein
MNPNGSISVTCSSGGTPPVDPNIATFTLTGPSTVEVNTYPEFFIKRTGGPANQKVAFGYGVNGVGCGWMSQGPFWLDRDESFKLGVYPIALGTCLITFGVQEGHNAAPTTKEMTITVGTVAPPPPPPPDPPPPGIPTVANCPAPGAGASMQSINWPAGATASEVQILRMNSGDVAVYEVQDYHGSAAKASVKFTQGQTTIMPAGVKTELTVSRCPGVIETNLHSACYWSSYQANFNAISAYNRAFSTNNTQELLAGYGCFAPRDVEKYYVNVRWTFPPQAVCGSNKGCGFSMQWYDGDY